jgi:hypothetical protein
VEASPYAVSDQISHDTEPGALDNLLNRCANVAEVIARSRGLHACVQRFASDSQKAL